MELPVILNKIRRSNLPSDIRSIAITAVIEYNKILEAAKAVKPKKETEKAKNAKRKRTPKQSKKTTKDKE